MRGLRTALSFLTLVPTGVGVPEARTLARAVKWFPLVGAGIGAIVGAVALAASLLGLPPLVSAAIAVTTGIVLTGAFHEDGLADTIDALGGSDPDERRRIMKDPCQGTFGVLALCLSVVLRIACLASIGPAGVMPSTIASHALGRTSAVAMMAAPVASRSGLGAAYATTTTSFGVVVAVLSGIAVTIWLLGIRSIVPIIAACTVAATVPALARKRFNGVTGDVVGAGEQLAEILVLVALSELFASRGSSPA